MSDPLVSVSDLGAKLRRTLDPADLSAIAAITDASNLFRSLSHQTISSVTDDVVELAGTWRRKLWLPERPVTGVKDVSITSPWDAWTLPDVNLQITRRGQLIRTDWCDWCGPDATVHLTYSHGYPVIPGDVKAVVLSMASRAFSNPTGVLSRSIGTYSESFAAADGSSLGLSGAELSVIRRYRPRS